MSLTEADIRSAAQATLRQWPAARAVVLFGSRARGEHRPDSDWDIAIITEHDDETPCDPPFYRLPSREIDLTFINARNIERNCNRLGMVDCEIACDGLLLAGIWHRPIKSGKPIMDREMYETEVKNALVSIENAFRTMHGPWVMDCNSLMDILAGSVDIQPMPTNIQ